MMILHVDGDSFFASCEIAQNERLRRKCVVTGFEKGIATSMSYEAKKRGVSRGMTMRQIKEVCPEAVVTNSSYDIYKIYSERMYKIVSRHANTVEEYSVDECFGIIESPEKAKKIQEELTRDLGMTFSVGVAPTKTLAKIASSWNKPAGFAVIIPENVPAFLEKIPIGKVWGIGSRMSQHLTKEGVKTALAFYGKPTRWIAENMAKPYQELWHELHGVSLLHVRHGNREKHKSVRKTRTFRPTKNKKVIFSELVKNLERACSRLRAHGLVARQSYFYLKTQQFMYYSSKEMKFLHPVSNPHEVMPAVQEYFESVYKPDVEYRATGFIFSQVIPATYMQPDLFNELEKEKSIAKLYSIIDALAAKYTSGIVRLAVSLEATRGDTAVTPTKSEREEKAMLKIGIPSWGESR